MIPLPSLRQLGSMPRALCFGLTIACVAPAAIAVDTYSITRAVFSSGGSTRAHSTCYALSSSSGQAVAGGPIGGGTYSAFAGFWAQPPATQDSVFSGGFENCGS